MPTRAKARPRPLRRRGAAKAIVETAPVDDATIVEGFDGEHRLSQEGAGPFGPVENRTAACAGRDRFSEEAPSSGETACGRLAWQADLRLDG